MAVGQKNRREIQQKQQKTLFFLQGTDLNEYKRNHWTLVLEVYGALRRYSVVLRSTGEARDEVPYCMGVYRMIDFKHGKGDVGIETSFG